MDDAIRWRVVELDADDTYEGLPEKVLSAVGWAHAKGRYTHFVKTDTDIIVDAKRYFPHMFGPEGLARSNPIVGRIAGLTLGTRGSRVVRCNFNPTWHFGKCSRDFLNSAPYEGVRPLSLDGSSTYVLSARAMKTAVGRVVHS